MDMKNETSYEDFYVVIISVNPFFYVARWLCYNIPFGIRESRGGQWLGIGESRPPVEISN